jgi:hypoxanthine phosphoribosyltransferase
LDLTVNIIGDILAVLGGFVVIGQIYAFIKRRISEHFVFTWPQVVSGIDKLVYQVSKGGFEPNMVIGLGRGGAIVAGLFASKLREKYEGDAKNSNDKLVEIALIDRIYLPNDGTEKEARITGLHTIDVTGKRILVLTADFYTGITVKKSKAALLDAKPEDIRTGCLFLFKLARGRSIEKPDFRGAEVPHRHVKKRLPWRGTNYKLEGKANLSVTQKPLLGVLHGHVATGKTNTTYAIGKAADLEFEAIHSDVYWFRYGLQNRHLDGGEISTEL